jgi:apolipoprotein N-acyltransferase
MRLLLGVGAAALTAALVWFGSGLFPIWPLLWFAPLPVLCFALGARWWSAALVAGLGWFVGNLNLFHLFTGALHAPAALALAVAAVPAFAFAMCVLPFRALVRRGADWTGLVALPSSWVALEYANSLTSVHGTAGSLAYSQIGFLPFLQLAALTGPWGMSFVLLLVPSSWAIAWHTWNVSRRRALRIGAASAAVLAAVLLFGAVRLGIAPSGEAVKVGLLASDPPVSAEVADEGPPTIRLLEAYAGEAEKLAASGARAIVLPEKIGVAVEPDTAAADAPLQAVADKTGAVIVAGLIRVAPPQKYNEARVYARGARVRSYDKEHLLPPFESMFEPGTDLTILPEPEAWGVAICKDMDFVPLGRRYGAAGVGILLVPAWDFVVDRAFHGHMAVMRGVESGFSVVRAAKQGFLTVSDNRGRILAETTSDSAPFAKLSAEVPAVHDTTLYLLWGDWFAGINALLLVLVLVRAMKRAGA